MQEAAEHAQRHYGLTGSLVKFATEKDDTFCLRTGAGTAYVVKFANPQEDEPEIELQVSFLNHLAKSDPSLPVPKVIENLGKQSVTHLTDASGQKRLLRVMTYLEGTVLDSTSTNQHEREKIGESLAKLRLACASFEHAHAKRPLAWDVQNLCALTPLLIYVEDASRREKLSQALERYKAIAPKLAQLRRQVLHNDFSQSNLVIDHENQAFVTGIIDFGDTVHTAIAIDVATALLNQLPRNAALHISDNCHRETAAVESVDIFEHGRDLLRGYLRIADLQKDELALLPDLVMARVVARALLTHWRASFMPKNKTYILRNTEPGWSQLDWFLAHTPERLSTWLTAH